VTDHQNSYPFVYKLSTTQQLSDSGLRIAFRVEASPENTGAMPFCLGMHFTFNFSSWWGDDWLSGTVQGLGDCAWRTNDRAQPADRFDLPSEAIPLKDSAFNSAIIPARADVPVKLVSPEGSRSLAMSFDETSGIKDGDLTWVSYVDAQKRFFCLEPWVGWPNAINSGRGRVELQPGQTWEFQLQMTVAVLRGGASKKPTLTAQKSLA
jgi:galactose mutarotase-like enzyme